MKLIPVLLLSAVLPLLSARGEEPTVSSVKLTRPDQPAVVRISITQGQISVIGSDRQDVAVESSAEPEHKESQRPDGLRVISASTGFSLVEKDNVVEVRYGSHGGFSGRADFKISVPKTASVEISNSWGADISVQSLSGDVDIKNMTGEITLNHVSGGALVETMNGEIHATYDAVTAGKPLSFTSMNGEVRLNLPSDVKANVRFRTQNGSILTDFPEDAMKTKTEDSGPMYGRHSEAARIAGDAAREAARLAREVADQVRDALHDNGAMAPEAPKPPRAPRMSGIPAMVGGKVVTGTLNGGGSDIQVATMNGDIVVRKSAK